MKKSDLKDLAELIDQKITANNQVIFKEVFHKMDNMEENILTSVKAEIDRLDERIGGLDEKVGNLDKRVGGLDERMCSTDEKVESIMSELKKKPDRYEMFDWTEKRLAQLKFN